MYKRSNSASHRQHHGALLSRTVFCLALGAIACKAGNSSSMNSDGGTDFDLSATCLQAEQPAVYKPVNLYIVFDKSSSMLGAKWDGARAGLLAVAQDQKSRGVNAALRFFPRPVDGTAVCDFLGYKEPQVDYRPLPSRDTALSDIFQSEMPDGTSSPIYPALGGALLKGMEVATHNSTAPSAVLLVTDGQPQGPTGMCGSKNPDDAQTVADLAAGGRAANPPVSTYVIGLPGFNSTTADLIAAAGGTKAAIRIQSADIQTDFRNALVQVFADIRPCAYEVPDEVKTGKVALGLVNLSVTSANGMSQRLPFDPACRDMGWHFDNDQAPTVLLPCPATCAMLRTLPDSGIQVGLGCSTLTN